MKNAKHVNYTQIDNESRITEEEDVIILTSPDAYERFSWSRKYFLKKPEAGYFIWAKKSLMSPLITNILICSQYVTQNSTNLVVVEENVKAKMYSTCAAQRGNLFGKHIGDTKIIVKKNARLEISHSHSWGKDDTVDSSMELILKEGAEASLSQKCRRVPRKLRLENRNYLDERASLNYAVTVLAEQGKIDMYDDTYLNGRKANGISRVKMIARENTQINAQSRMFANKASTGHLDCMGLLLGDESSIVAIPELINRDKEASLTHEASVGKISDEVLNYLRSRGLTEDQAIDLIITGFLGEEEKIVVEGAVISSKVNM
ncbi:SufB/SufD family protein [Wukongibacter sp. M2B1]|uniref:SufB/SufD family protein n=1 Tax=Wukongibacter sp. M2B1 TaxID=3088895 RepID=UPI003D79994F